MHELKMKNAKKLICILVLGCIVCTHYYNVYQTCYATEVVVTGGLASVGVALLGLGAIAGVGMELDNNRRFNELPDEEKQRIENGLATNFEDVALQRGASLEHIKNWTTDLCNGVLDKASECWGIFKDWIKNVELTNKPNVSGSSLTLTSILPVSVHFPNTNYVTSFSMSDYEGSLNDVQAIQIYISNWSNNHYAIVIDQYYWEDSNKTTLVKSSDKYRYYPLNNTWGFESHSSGIINSTNIDTYSTTIKAISTDGVTFNYNGASVDNIGYNDTLFSTNTDYLEKLKGQDEDVIDVIDVTDIKNPIIETRPNSLANINWNRGTRRTNNNNDDDDNKMVTGLVPMDIWYEQIDDEQEQMQNAVVVYNNYIQEHPEEKDTYFISATPITNINNYFNTLPVVNIPAQGTIVNNNYEYNNYNNNNVTIYQEPYNTGIIPTFPDFKNKFPFCIPFDLYEFFVVFLAEKEAPKIEIPFPIIDNTNHQLTIEHITIDLAPYEYLSDVLRVMMFILFCVGLMLLTRQLIKG